MQIRNENRVPEQKKTLGTFFHGFQAKKNWNSPKILRFNEIKVFPSIPALVWHYKIINTVWFR